MKRKINWRSIICVLVVGLLFLGLTGCGAKDSGNSEETIGNKATATVEENKATATVEENKATATVEENKATTTVEENKATSTVEENKATSAVAVSSNAQIEIIVSEGNDPDSLVEKGFKAMGGIEKFVKKGSSVVIKPNFSVNRKPEDAATTNPQLIAAVVKQCLKAGAKEVKVIDNSFSGPLCIVNSGIKAAVEAAGGKAFNINEERYYKEVDIGGKVLGKAEYSKDVLDADVLINMPILKHHAMTQVTMGLKNMMGLVWDRQFFHRTDLNECIAELNAYRKADLTIMDAIKGITDRGPMGPGTIHEWNQVIFGTDPVAVDAYGADLFGLKPTDIGHLVAAAKLNLGEIDLEKITVVKVK
jgi:uncharacterized protein (DUF362 family)